MKYLLVLMLLCCSAIGTSQARVGFHIDDVKKDFPAIEPINDSIFVWNTLNAAVRYHTDSLGFVTETVIYPLTKKDENIYFNYYNNHFIKRGYSSWIYMQGEDSCYITKVRKGSSDSVYFVWTYNANNQFNYASIH